MSYYIDFVRTEIKYKDPMFAQFEPKKGDGLNSFTTFRDAKTFALKCFKMNLASLRSLIIAVRTDSDFDNKTKKLITKCIRVNIALLRKAYMEFREMRKIDVDDSIWW